MASELDKLIPEHIQKKHEKTPPTPVARNRKERRKEARQETSGVTRDSDMNRSFSGQLRQHLRNRALQKLQKSKKDT